MLDINAETITKMLRIQNPVLSVTGNSMPGLVIKMICSNGFREVAKKAKVKLSEIGHMIIFAMRSPASRVIVDTVINNNQQIP